MILQTIKGIGHVGRINQRAITTDQYHIVSPGHTVSERTTHPLTEIALCLCFLREVREARQETHGIFQREPEFATEGRSHSADEPFCQLTGEFSRPPVTQAFGQAGLHLARFRQLAENLYQLAMHGCLGLLTAIWEAYVNSPCKMISAKIRSTPW